MSFIVNNFGMAPQPTALPLHPGKTASQSPMRSAIPYNPSPRNVSPKPIQNQQVQNSLEQSVSLQQQSYISVSHQPPHISPQSQAQQQHHQQHHIILNNVHPQQYYSQRTGVQQQSPSGLIPVTINITPQSTSNKSSFVGNTNSTSQQNSDNQQQQQQLQSQQQNQAQKAQPTIGNNLNSFIDQVNSVKERTNSIVKQFSNRSVNTASPCNSEKKGQLKTELSQKSLYNGGGTENFNSKLQETVCTEENQLPEGDFTHNIESRKESTNLLHESIVSVTQETTTPVLIDILNRCDKCLESTQQALQLNQQIAGKTAEILQQYRT